MTAKTKSARSKARRPPEGGRYNGYFKGTGVPLRDRPGREAEEKNREGNECEQLAA